MWNLLVKEMPYEWKFLEIGVFKGQTVNLVSLLNEFHHKKGLVYGITPLDNTGKPGEHPVDDYEYRIGQIYQRFGLDMSDLMIIEGLSTNPAVVETANELGPYDILYIDGGHDYETVLSDLQKYTPMVKPHGYVVVDDASCDLNIPDGLIRMDWKGIPEVCEAVNSFFPFTSAGRFEHLFAVGHNRVWRKYD